MADWDTDDPADDDIVSQFPANERDARSAVQSNFGVDHHDSDDADVGKHELVTLLAQGSSPGSAAGQLRLFSKTTDGITELFCIDSDGNERQLTAAGRINADLVTQSDKGFMSAADKTKLDGIEGGASSGGDIPSGTEMVFIQGSAPTGWTQTFRDSERVLISNDFGGGGTGGSWTISGLSVDGHALTELEMAGHTHNYITVNTFEIITVDNNGDGSTTQAFDDVTEERETDGDNQGGFAHDHGISHDGSWRPKYLEYITAVKD